MSELTERLHTNCPDEWGECIECAQLKVDAADEIERQSAEITRLHYESGVLFEKWDLAKKVADLRLKTIKGLEDKLAAAEAALREAKCCVYNMTPTRTVDDQFDTLDEQLGFLLPQIKQLQTKLAAAEACCEELNSLVARATGPS